MPLTLFSISSNVHYLFQKYIDNGQGDIIEFYTYYEGLIYLSFLPVIWYNKLYSWIPSIIFGTLVIIANYFDYWHLMSVYYARLIQYVLRVLMYLCMLPNLMRYNLFVLVFQYLSLTCVDIAYLILGFQENIQAMTDLYHFINYQSYIGILFIALEIMYQMFRRRMVCFK